MVRCGPCPPLCCWPAAAKLGLCIADSCCTLGPRLQIHTLAIVAASLCGVVAVLATLVAFGLSATYAGAYLTFAAFISLPCPLCRCLTACLASYSHVTTLAQLSSHRCWAATLAGCNLYLVKCPHPAGAFQPRRAPLCRCRGAGDEREACAELTEVTFYFALWYTGFCILSTAVGRRTRRMRLLLNPVSSGVVQL